MKISVGTVVSLKSNGLLSLANHHFLSLGGNENFTTPLMVVTEIMYKISPEIDEESGDEKSVIKGGNKYKCIYFSNKSMKFEENWFFQNEISIYGDEENHFHNVIDSKELKWGDTVRFKTVDEEARKTKSYSENEKQKGLKPLLTFTSPAMQVVGFTNLDKKEPLIDINTGKKKREISERLVKCKFFNTDSDKFSEQLVPIECLQKIDNSDIDKKMESISDYLNKNSFVIVKTLDESEYFGKPQTVSVFSGRYQLVFYNELLKKNVLIWMDLIMDFNEVNVLNGDYYPSVYTETKKFESVEEYISSNEELIENWHFKIVYKNLKEQIISRYISVQELTVEIENDEIKKKYHYLTSYCHLREAERLFRSDRILSIRTIKDEILIEFLDSKIGS